MFKVKATVVKFLGDVQRYPCHHQYQLGDEFIFDGAAFSGSVCPSLAITLVPKMMELHSAGPRYRDYLFYYPFLYAPLSVDDPESKKLDGLGYKNVLSNYQETPYHMSKLTSSETFTWPPRAERFQHRDVSLICPDFRTSVVVKVEAFDLSDAGRNIPFFRREMTILDKVLKNPGIKKDRILNEFTLTQVKDIYPAMGQAMVDSLLEEMEVVGYLEIRDGQVFPNPKAKAKLAGFKKSLTKDEKSALGL
jgi:uncharacterized repeat protein (TIGR04076 family)